MGTCLVKKVLNIKSSILSFLALKVFENFDEKD